MKRKSFLATCLCALLGLSAQARADLPHGYHDRVESPQGVMEVRGTLGDRYLVWNGARLDVADWDVDILGLYSEPGSPHVWAVVTSSTGGNGCFPSYVILRIGPDGIRRTPLVGNCSDVQALRLSDGVFTLEQPSPSLTSRKLVVTYDGTNLTQTEVAAVAPAASALSDEDKAVRWIGRHPNEPFRNPEEQARFLQIMTWPQLDELKDFTAVGREVEWRGDWVLGAGCFAHDCGARKGAWGIRLSTGAAVAVLMELNHADRRFGARSDLADGTFRQFVSEHRPK